MKPRTVLALLIGIAIGGVIEPVVPNFPNTFLIQEQFDDSALKKALEGLGYEAKPLSKGFLITEKVDTWTINAQVVLSQDRNKIGLNANLGEVPEPNTISASQWMGLLVANGDIDPSSFYFDTKTKKLYLHRSFDNRSLSPTILKREIQNFTKNVKETADLWKFTK